jgi:OOP family OmpA-OmpF porin
MIKRSALAILAILAIAAASSATPAAAQGPFYGVVGMGRSTIDVDPSSVDRFALANGLATSSTATSTKDFGWKLQLGLPISSAFAVEGGYMSLGRSTFINTNNLYIATGDKQASLFNLDLVAKMPLNQSFSLLGRVGAYRWETESNLPTSAGMSYRTDDGFDWKFGAGVQYQFTNTFALRGAYDRFNGIGSSGTAGDSKANLLSVDAVLKF